VSKCESGKRRVDVIDLLDFAAVYRKPINHMKKGGNVPMSQTVYEVLTALREAHTEHGSEPTGFVFRNKRTGIRMYEINNGFTSAAKEAGLKEMEHEQRSRGVDGVSTQRRRFGRPRQHRVVSYSLSSRHLNWLDRISTDLGVTRSEVVRAAIDAFAQQLSGITRSAAAERIRQSTDDASLLSPHRLANE
jgi:hypothetical protein